MREAFSLTAKNVDRPQTKVLAMRAIVQRVKEASVKVGSLCSSDPRFSRSHGAVRGSQALYILQSCCQDACINKSLPIHAARDFCPLG